MRILWLKTELLHPVDKGGKIRTFNMLRELKREHHITYLTLDDGSAAEDARAAASEYCNELVCIPHKTSEKFSMKFYWELLFNLFSSLPYALTKYLNSEMRREIESRISKGDVDLLICDFLTPAVNIPDNLMIRSVLFQHNVEAMIWKRHFEVQTNPAKKAYFYNQFRKMRAFEERTCLAFDEVIAVSRQDADAMRSDYGISNVDDVPTGVDTEFFKPSGAVERKNNNLVFTGSMDWLPNQDAILWFSKDVLPLIRNQVPDVTLTVVGRNPLPDIVALGKTSPSIEVTGRVEDVRPFMERAAVYIVPIRIGGGTRLKIYEAMAMEQAIVSTTIGAEGLPVENGKHLIIGDTAETFASAVIKVLNDSVAASDLGSAAAKLVRERFGWGGVTDRFIQLATHSAVSANPNQAEPTLRPAREIQ